jgi:septal ring factor EnvC (AmiA/AmiB activator)
MTPTDPIIEEIHAIREELAKESGYDTERIAEAARKRQAESGRKVATLPPRPAAHIKKGFLIASTGGAGSRPQRTNTPCV